MSRYIAFIIICYVAVPYIVFALHKGKKSAGCTWSISGLLANRSDVLSDIFTWFIPEIALSSV